MRDYIAGDFGGQQHGSWRLRDGDCARRLRALIARSGPYGTTASIQTPGGIAKALSISSGPITARARLEDSRPAYATGKEQLEFLVIES